MILLAWLALAVAAFAAASVLALYSYGRFARRAQGVASQMLPLAPDATAIDRALSPAETAQPGATGVACLFEGRGALAYRLASARAAGRSLDLMYYIWRDDLAGRMLARELLLAADRGVRVRLLLDDINVQGLDPKYLALNGHPNIEVRLFNPIRARRTVLGRGVELALGLVRFNRRMHCKLWLADGRLAITGGRNVGNIYFDVQPARRRITRDAELLLAGQVAHETGAVFDGYWNSGLALPINKLWSRRDSGVERFRARIEAEAASPAARAVLDAGKDAPLLPPEGLCWTRSIRLLHDPPAKALGRGREGWLPAALVPMLEGARASIRIVSPYFVPGAEGLARLAALARGGVQVDIVTNALTATDHTIVHGAYRRYRRALLGAGARLHEFAPVGRTGLRGQMLHSKIFLVDDARAFVGSFNFDLRSAFLNTEMGVVCSDPTVLDELRAEVARLCAPDAAYTLELDGRVMRWWRGCGARQKGAIPVLHEPEAPALRRGASWVIGHLPIHRML